MALAEAENGEKADEEAGIFLEPLKCEADHGGREGAALEQRVIAQECAEQDRAAHGVRERMAFQIAERGHGLFHDGVEIVEVIVEARDMAFCRVREEPIRSALTTPVKGNDVEAAGAEVADRFPVFLHEFCAA